jgi:HlyD family secretion protein
MMQEQKQIDRRLLWAGGIILLVAVFFVARAMTREHLTIHVAKTVRTELVSTVSTNGRVEPETNYEFHSPTNTTVRAVYAQPGDLVPAGKLLIELDDLPARARLASAESGVKNAEATYEAAQHSGTKEEREMMAGELAKARLDRNQAMRDLDALKKLQSNGAASASEVAAAEDRFNAAEANLKSAEERSQHRYSTTEIERAKAALTEAQTNLLAARRVLEQTSYRAPVSGTVYSIDVSKTQYAEEGKTLLQMADLKHVRVRAYFDEPEIGRLAVGQQILIHWDAKPGQEWHGHIVRVPSTIIAYGTRNVGEVLVAIDDPDGTLLPDTNVTVKVTLSSEHNSLSIPREALRYESSKAYVFRVVGDELVRTPVTIGTLNLAQVAILSGLNDGDVVATSSLNGQPLEEGVPIKVVR